MTTIDLDLGKVSITAGGSFRQDVSYSALTVVVYEAPEGDGCGYVSLKDTIGVAPGSDPLVWKKVSEAGRSIYQLCKDHGTFVGTEEEFVAAYNAAVKAANDAATNATSTVETLVAAVGATMREYAATMQEYADVELSRSEAESGRARAETARASAEQGRAQAETARQASENSRASAEQHRADTFAEQMEAIATAKVLADNATTAANTAAALADEKAALANEKAGVAQQAADAADTAREGIQEDLGKKADKADLLDGTLVPKVAEDLENWTDRNTPVEDTFTDVVRTSAGDVSIKSDNGAQLISIAPKTLRFKAASFRTSGFDLLLDGITVGTGKYFPICPLPFGTFGTALQPNGILFTNSARENLRPTVYFKPLEGGIPASVTDGSLCPYTDSNGYRFYNPPAIGYLIVSGITVADTCAHIGWSRRYDEFNKNTIGGTITLSSIFNAMHSHGYIVKAKSIADRIFFNGTTATGYVNCDYVQPVWNTVQNEDGTYTHSAVISAMAPNGAAECEDADLLVDGTTVSYTSGDAEPTSSIVTFELASKTTVTKTTSNALPIEDWGLEGFFGAEGQAYATTQYSQGYPDGVAALISGGLDEKDSVVAAHIAGLTARIEAIEKSIANGFGFLSVDNLTIHNLLSRTGRGNDILKGGGAPSAETEPEGWNESRWGIWAGIPSLFGQLYYDETGGHLYFAKGTDSVSDWMIIF